MSPPTPTESPISSEDATPGASLGPRSPQNAGTLSDAGRPRRSRAPDVRSLERPHRNLLVYYALFSLFFGPFFPIAFAYSLFRYRTLRYTFDDEGVSMRWGILFRREISLTYARIQDIHLVSNIVERHLGLARLHIQTAAGAAKAEMTVEGLLEFEAVRDFLYEHMRSRARRSGSRRPAAPTGAEPEAGIGELREVRPASDMWLPVVEALRETAAELRQLRRELASARAEEGSRAEDGAAGRTNPEGGP